MKQTAVFWLQQVITTHLTDDQIRSFEGLFQQALEMEKDQIMKAWLNGFEENRPYVDHSEDYYNETYMVKPDLDK